MPKAKTGMDETWVQFLALPLISCKSLRKPCRDSVAATFVLQCSSVCPWLSTQTPQLCVESLNFLYWS